MILDEAITKCLIGEEHLDQAEYEQVGEWLQELYTLRVELEKNSKELELYKKALIIACNKIIMYRICNENYSGEDDEQLVGWLLEEARDENERTDSNTDH